MLTIAPPPAAAIFGTECLLINMAPIALIESIWCHRSGVRSMSAVPPNQAGYLWCCNVRDVSARWTVPRLVHPAAEGAEAVWIGAQTQTGDFFLQVGTNEYVSQLTSEYQAFWSDGPLNGAPQPMGALAPGDQVVARLVHERQRGLALVDRRADRAQALITAQPPSRAFDPASYRSGGGGMVGTAHDVLRFLEAIRAGGAPILDRATVEFIKQHWHLPPGPGSQLFQTHINYKIQLN